MIKVCTKRIADLIEDQKIIKDWVKGLTEKSKDNYLRALVELLLVTHKTPQELLNIAFQEKSNEPPPGESQVKQWFLDYTDYYNRSGKSKTTRERNRNIVKSFFHFYELKTPKQSTRRNKTDPLKVKNRRKALTKERIKEALDASRTLRLKAIILIQLSSGLSDADIVNLTLKQFYQGLTPITDDKEEICVLHITREKTGRNFITFLSYEAVDAVKNYIFNERRFHFSPWLFTKHQLKRNHSNPKLTPHLVMQEYRQLNDEWMGNEHEESGLFREITGHMCRKAFNTFLTNSEMNYEPRKHMMGHKVPGVDDNYYLEHQDELMELYIKHMGRITINPTKTITLESKEYQELKEKDKQREQEREEERREHQEMLEREREKDKVLEDALRRLDVLERGKSRKKRI